MTKQERLLEEAKKMDIEYNFIPSKELLTAMLKVYLPHIKEQVKLAAILESRRDEGPCKNPKCAGNGHTTDGNWCWCY